MAVWGGNADTSTVNSAAEIIITGNNSYGITAQSIGGGGGNGGSTVGVVSLGAAGKSGGDGSSVTVVNQGSLHIQGTSSYGILAQSIGGGGGNAGLSAGLVGIGGRGGSGGTAGEVEVRNTSSGEITTIGKNGHGIVAQSIGGGGGNGGLTVGAGLFGVAIGGDGGAGNDSDKVKVENDANITTGQENNKTLSDNSVAILAQSIGGGGGNGSLAISGGAGFSLAVGGSGAGGGKAGSVEVEVGKNATAEHETRLTTWGNNSAAIKAQSIGGGGGNGGVAISANIGVTGVGASIALGGSGGNGGLAGSFSIAGSLNNAVTAGVAIGGSGGSASNVRVESSDNITTLGQDSNAILAQSIGGGGGNGGTAVVGTLTVSAGAEGGAYSANVSLGGQGGSGNSAGTVNVDSLGTLITFGDSSHGVLAQSIGGGGGNGGMSIAATLTASRDSSMQASVAIGGKGGVGGMADKVTVLREAEGEIYTFGDSATGITAQSIGGGGGNGGSAISFTGSLLDTTSVAFSLGGSGGRGNEAGEVNVLNKSDIYTLGDQAQAIKAQSIGGGGGIGGHASGTLGIGGFGSLGGKSSIITVQNSGQISTSKIDSTAILAQSIAGGGGLGGGASASVAIGGFGGDGADSDDVNVQNTGNLFTEGRNASAIVAQSISGGGGKGGSSDGGVVTKDANTTTIESAYVAIGGNGGGAGDAGDVIVNNTADSIETKDNQSKGIVAQSIAGGGGMGGEVNGIDVSDIINDNTQNLLATFDQGAAAAGLGNGAIYSVHNLSNKLASGLSSTASTIIGVLSTPLELYYKNLATPSNGGSSGKVVLTNAANSIIHTFKNGSEAMVAQSISGGGGTTGSVKGLLVSGAYNGGAGDSDLVTASNNGILLTKGEHSSAIVAQSISGGGGLASGLDNVSSYAVLGGEGASGQSGKVEVRNDNILYTAGKLSSAIVAQSITGGGGIVGLSHYLQFGNAVDASINDAGQASDVEAISTGFITTEGDGAVAIVAQSIGGGGGYAAGVDQDNSPLDNASNTAKGDASDVIIKLGPMPVAALSQQIQQNNDQDDDSVAITPIQKIASIYTTGNYAHGIIAQSLAGGGGYTNFIDGDGDISGFFAGTSGGQGEAGNISVALDGRVITTGVGSIGVLAQSAGSQNGNIAIDIAKDTVVIGGSGNGAALALYDGNGNTVLNKGYLTGTGTIDSYYVNDDIRLERVGYSDSFAIIGENSSNTITNDGGFITGSIYLPDGSSTLINENNGWVLTSELIQMSNDIAATSLRLMARSAPVVGQIYNYANWSIGGVDEVSSTSVIGDFTQSGSGVFYFDYNADRNSAMADIQNRMMTMSTNSSNPYTGTYDTMDVSGTANLDGTIAINVMNAGLITPGDFNLNLNFINASQLNIASGLQLVFLPSAISRYNIQDDGNGGVAILTNYNYIQDSLTDNGVSMGAAINRIQTVQNTPEFERIAEVLYYSPDLQTLQANYNAISGEGSAAIHQSAFTLANDAINDISTQMDFWRSKSNLAKTNGSVALTCSDEDSKGSSRQNVNNCQDSNKWRLWIAGNDGHQILSGKSKDGIADVTSNSNHLLVALDYEINANTLVGAAFVDGRVTYDIQDRASTGIVDSRGVTFYGIKDFDQYYVKALLGYDWLKASTTRDIYLKGNDEATPPVADIQNRVEADFNGQMLTTRVEAGYKYILDGINVTPFAGAQFAMTQFNRSTELEITGAGTDMGLSYEKNRNYSAPLFVGVQFDKNYDLNIGSLQPYARFSVNHDLSTDRKIEASFISAPGYLFTVNGGEPQKTSFDMNLGFKLNTKANVSIFGQYNGKFSSSNSKTDHVNFGIEYSW